MVRVTLTQPNSAPAAAHLFVVSLVAPNLAGGSVADLAAATGNTLATLFAAPPCSPLPPFDYDVRSCPSRSDHGATVYTCTIYVYMAVQAPADPTRYTITLRKDTFVMRLVQQTSATVGGLAHVYFCGADALRVSCSAANASAFPLAAVAPTTGAGPVSSCAVHRSGENFTCEVARLEKRPVSFTQVLAITSTDGRTIHFNGSFDMPEPGVVTEEQSVVAVSHQRGAATVFSTANVLNISFAAKPGSVPVTVTVVAVEAVNSRGQVRDVAFRAFPGYVLMGPFGDTVFFYGSVSFRLQLIVDFPSFASGRRAAGDNASLPDAATAETRSVDVIFDTPRSAPSATTPPTPPCDAGCKAGIAAGSIVVVVVVAAAVVVLWLRRGGVEQRNEPAAGR